MDLYADHILDHFRSPRSKHPLSDPSVTHEEKNLSCGDSVNVSLRLENGRITEIGWDGSGCAISQAGMSMLSEELVGKTVEETIALTPKHVTEMLGVPISPRRLKCALLSLHTVQNALHASRGESTQTWAETAEEAID